MSDYFKKYYLENREKLLEKAKERYLNKKEQIKSYHEEYYSRPEIIDKVKEYKRTYFQNNKEKVYKYREENKEKIKEYNKKQRIKRSNRIKEGRINPEVWFNLVEYFENCCAYCGKESKLEMDHFIPLSRGGTHSEENIFPACRSCNASKGNKMLDEWDIDMYNGLISYMNGN